MEAIISGSYRIAGYVSAYVIDGYEGVTLIDTPVPKRKHLITRVMSVARVDRSPRRDRVDRPPNRDPGPY